VSPKAFAACTRNSLLRIFIFMKISENNALLA
jgi:hypothetical protein